MIRFLTHDEILLIHADQLLRYGGTPGIRDTGLLDSAVAQPQATFQGRYLHDDLFDMAAAYLVSLVNNHPFLDGNKRVGATAALIFLDLNGIEMTADEDDFSEMVFAIARGTLTRDMVAAFLRTHSRRER
jgi:death-on-curing protein